MLQVHVDMHKRFSIVTVQGSISTGEGWGCPVVPDRLLVDFSTIRPDQVWPTS
ncbi:MAG: hypothetical protein ABIK86_07445 [candidate division WOR-3 bacterium]